jgi:thiol-disulfide isomerase/thioredoxin
MIVRTGFKFLCLWLLMAGSIVARADVSLTYDVLGEEFTLQQFPASGRQLVLYVAPGYGFNPRGTATAKALSDLGVEVWMVNLAENLFLPQGNDSIHSFDGRYVAKLIELAHKQTGKNITLLSSSFGAIPVLRGARQWQLNNAGLKRAYLNGAILFSPELYRSTPPLGLEPDFEPIASATNIPIMIYQSELRNNRWQLDSVIRNLEKSKAVVYRKILPDIVSFFYEIDELPQTLKTLRELPAEIPRIIKILESTTTPLNAIDISKAGEIKNKNLDIKLKGYKGDKSPLPLDLVNINGERVVRNDYRGKVTVVNFWATWCPPCIEEIPMLNRLSTKMKDSNFELLSVNFGQAKTTIEEFLKKVNVEFPVLLDDKGRTSGSWNTIVLPSTFVIGPDGKFAYAVNAAIKWDSPEVVAALKKLAGDSPSEKLN